MKQNINQILKEVLININPSKEELNSINKFLKEFIDEVEKKFKVLKIDAELFVGGSFAKKTLIKK
jgi:tRNA nucleotidyltransferase (CCA-adding enzyme)